MIIKTTHREETAQYAAEELQKYLNKMAAGCCTEIRYINTTETGEGVITLGLLEEFGYDSSDVEDVVTDDVIDIRIQNGSGTIAGSNIRSILLGVYAYLRGAGCRFIRPGEEGEYIPKVDMNSFSYTYRKKADYPFRGECIEGAVSFEHVRDTIIWSPKVGMNMFMMEQIIPYNYISRWYKHNSNTILKDENVSFEQVGEYVKELELLIKKCGLQLHALGHGYLLEPYGIHYKTINDPYELNDEAREDIALVNGKRELYLGSPNFTQMCMSRKEVRAKQVKFLVDYMKKKPYIDFLHVWLSDAVGNHCECEQCKPYAVSDLYVKLLNELDEALSAEGIDTKVVFILYTDTLWAPETEVIKNPDRFIILTAVGGRDFSKPYDKTPYEGPTPKYCRNHNNISQTFPLSMRFLQDWERAFVGKKMIFEYHMYTHHYSDPGYMRLAELLMADCKNVKNFGIEGIMSDQTQRSFFPNGLPMCAYAEAMFDRSVEFDDFVEDYFKAAYGKDYQLSKEYLSEISRLMSPDILQIKMNIVDVDAELGSKKKVPVKGWVNNPEMQENFRTAMKLAADFKAVAMEHLAEEDPAQRRSWMLLVYHTDYIRYYADLLLAQSLGEEEKMKKIYEEMIDALSHIELEISGEFDLHLFDNSVKNRMR